MTATIQLHPGMRVIGSDGDYLGEIDELLEHHISRRVTGVVVKSGQWFWTERRVLSADLVKNIDANANTVEVYVGKPMFRAIRTQE